MGSFEHGPTSFADELPRKEQGLGEEAQLALLAIRESGWLGLQVQIVAIVADLSQHK